MSNPPQEASSAEPRDKKAEARNLFMERRTPQEICALVGVTPSTLARWRRDGEWEVEREQVELSLNDDGSLTRRLTISRIGKLTADQIERCVVAIGQRLEPPTLDEGLKLSTILANLDRISRLDAGKSTENVAVKHTVQMTANEIRDVLLADPFMKSVEDE